MVVTEGVDRVVEEVGPTTVVEDVVAAADDDEATSVGRRESCLTRH